MRDAVAATQSRLGSRGGATEWWDRPWFLLAVVILSAIPLIFPASPPLVDLPGHLGRYRVELDLDSSADLQRYFDFHWAMVGNLGVDLLIIPLAPVLGVENAVKLIVLAIPSLTAAGILLTAREVHGRVPPTALLAIPFIYNYPFHFGFLNYALAMALALLAFGLWLRLARQGRFRFRAALFVVISVAIWFAHMFGWVFLCVLCGSAELIRHRDAGRTWIRSIAGAATACASLLLPAVLMIMWRSGATGGLTAYYGFVAKLVSLAAVLRDRWFLWDIFGVFVALTLVGVAVFDKRLTLSRVLALPAALLAVSYFVMPDLIFGSAYADTRLAPFALILAIAAIDFRRPVDFGVLHKVAVLAGLFMVLRIAGNTVSFGLAAREADEQLQALDHVPRGAAVLSLVGAFCGEEWKMPRHLHFGSFVIVRMHGFSNDQYKLPGAALLTIHYPAAGDFASDPSELVFGRKCLARSFPSADPTASRRRSADRALSEFPRQAFDYVWLVRPPDFEMTRRPGLTPAWRGRDSILYRVSH